jgi:hypothetical protein
MATLTNTKIKDTYDGLLKTTDNEALDVSGVTLIEDGLGNASALSVGRSGNGVTITGNLAVDTNTLYVDAASDGVGFGTTNLTVGIGNTDTGASVRSVGAIQASRSGNRSLYLNRNTTDGQILSINRDGSEVGAIGAAGSGLTFYTGITERMRIDSSGNVDIANGRLQVNTNSATGAVVRLDYNSTDSIRRIHALETGGGNARPLQIHAQDVRFRDDSSERMRIDSAGNVGIGTSSPQQLLSIQNTASNAYLHCVAGTSNLGGVWVGDSDANYVGGFLYDNGINTSLFYTNSSERMRIDSSGNVRLSGTAPSAEDTISKIDFYNNSSSINLAGIEGKRTAGGTNYGSLIFNTTNSGTSSEKMRIDSSGNVGIGRTPSYKLDVADFGGSDVTIHISSNQTASGILAFGDNAAAARGYVEYDHVTNNLILGTTATERMRINSSGYVGINNNNPQVALQVTGDVDISASLSKGSGSFKIDHPLENKKDTHHLVHSFVESPQANNIYRGKVQLVNGSATINLDEESTMTEGTFVLLNRDIHTYTSNESDWDAVRGSVEGNILTIECQNSESDAIVSWLVIGERHDQHMYDTSWTNENGKVIVEPLKIIEE